MPFTVSHPAAVLPLLGLRLPASALVIGSLAPDLPYFLPTPFTPIETHTLGSVVGSNLLLGLFAFLVWHLLLVPPMRWIAPAGLQQRLPPPEPQSLATRLASVGGFARLCLALILGAFTHVVLDAFTHEGGRALDALPWLNGVALGLPMYRWLHLTASVAGLSVLAWFLVHWWRRAGTDWPSRPIPPRLRWGLVTALILWSALTPLQAATSLATGEPSYRLAVVAEQITEFLSSLALATLAAALLWHVVNALQPDPSRLHTPK